jgi:hypothetical protein
VNDYIPDHLTELALGTTPPPGRAPAPGSVPLPQEGDDRAWLVTLLHDAKRVEFITDKHADTAGGEVRILVDPGAVLDALLAAPQPPPQAAGDVHCTGHVDYDPPKRAALVPVALLLQAADKIDEWLEDNHGRPSIEALAAALRLAAEGHNQKETT